MLSDSLRQELTRCRELMETFSLKQAFNGDSGRYKRMHRVLGPLLFDFSRHMVTDELLELLGRVAEELRLQQSVDSLCRGDFVNFTEKKPALHLALRDRSGLVKCPTKRAEVIQSRQKMLAYVESLRSGVVHGARGQIIDTVVNLGVGGSDLGGFMCVEALRSYADSYLKVHFVSSMDGVVLHRLLEGFEPDRTMFVISSKSFSTVDTFENVRAVKEWYKCGGYANEEIAAHFSGISACPNKMEEFGIPKEQQFLLGDYIGGRFSISSCIGFPLACAIGVQGFDEFLDGMHAVDRHVCVDATSSIPAMMALLEWWYSGYWQSAALAVLPYHQDLHRFPAYLTQLQMESLGKRIATDGEAVDVQTGGVVFGEVGSNAQHSFMQLLHQGTRIIPADFILFAKMPETSFRQCDVTLANGLAQGRALAFGYDSEEARRDLLERGMEEQDLAAVLPHYLHPGNRPSSTLLFDALNPYTLGMLVAMYEHKTHLMSCLWDINAFDQMGVELGKRMAQDLLPFVSDRHRPFMADSSTQGLLAVIHDVRRVDVSSNPIKNDGRKITYISEEGLAIEP